MTSIVSAPADPVVVDCDDIKVFFAGIDLAAILPAHVPVPLGVLGVQARAWGVRGPETMQRDSEFQAARLAWSQRRRSGGSVADEPVPTMPGVLVVDQVKALLRDDLGTEYLRVAGRIGGEGTEWQGSWTYPPQPPEAARTLWLEFTLDGEPAGKGFEIRVQ
ncbi:hypothetical protein [Kocuria sabuli]|uniref:hypothetical protein n=1 Tax=Kocuria sabuli TaxID=3071448 RepID=UPI0034D65CEC